MSLLRPSGDQMRRFAERETDPRQARRFEAIAAGPLVAVLVLAWAGLLGALAAPVVVLARIVGRRR